MRRVGPALLVLGVALALIVPAGAQAGGASSGALHGRFDRAVSALGKGQYKRFCRLFTKASLRRFGGVSGCAKGIKAQSAAFNLRQAAASLKVTSIKVDGSRGTVRWSAAGRHQSSTWAYERGAWRMSVFLAG